MEEQLDKAMAVFYQVCEVNELDPETIKNEAGKTNPSTNENGQDAEKLIRAALETKANELLHQAGQQLPDNEALYTIDGDPAAPAFVVNEDSIRDKYDEPAASNIIEALSKVLLPVQG